ncbi:MAG: hypothetical protein ACP5GJ_00675 [Nanopusillaceae archaeon]|jgi:high-affinity Fe2+/Pb2+ permease
MKNDISIDTLIIIIIAIILLILAIVFVFGIYKGGANASNQSFNFINGSLNNLTNQSIPQVIQ